VAVRWRRTLAATIVATSLIGCHRDHADASASATSDQHSALPDTVVLNDQQLKNVRVVKVQSMPFIPSVETLGYIDFDQDRSVPVFPAVPGRVRSVMVQVGETIRSRQTLYTIDSPDFVTAQSNLVSSAGALALTTSALERAGKMLAIQATAQKDLEQAQADHQNAEATYRSARATLRIFGLNDSDMAELLARHQVSPELPVRSAIDGQVTARNAAPGILVQPGTAPAPVTVSDTSVKWMIANAGEADLASLKLGQPVLVKVLAYPDRTFAGHIANIGAGLDPNTHRVAVRSEIQDPEKILRPQMMASFTIQTGQPAAALAVPADALVREGDGTMTVFVSRDGHSFTRRTVRTGAQRDNMIAVESGLEEGEQVAAEGALFLSNALALQSQ
jgi:cobalt-zinc-cadmium efflux system membrane fusion protein